MSMSEKAASLRALFDRLTCYKVVHWGVGSSDPSVFEDVSASVADAHVVSSLRGGDPTGRHAVVLDIDHPAWLVESSTPGHFHLYIDVPGGIPDHNYRTLLNVLAVCGVIEEGYKEASLARGHSDVRLPWIKKPIQPPAPDPWAATVSGNQESETDPWL